jgi:hypothetical protein
MASEDFSFLDQNVFYIMEDIQYEKIRAQKKEKKQG